MINVYDFDGTIYDGDSSVDFYIYCIKKNPLLIRYTPLFLISTVLYKLKIKDKEYMKGSFFSIVRGIDNIDAYVKDFWSINNKKIKNWYINQRRNTDIIISASPDVLIDYIGKELGVAEVIATKINSKTGKLESKNCSGYEKIIRYEKLHSKESINEFYTDDIKSDLPMLKYSKIGYIVKKNSIIRWKND